MSDTIMVALITTMGGVIVALVGLVAHDQRKTRSAVGTPNGHGDVVQMQERTLRELGSISTRLDDGDRRMGRIDTSLAQVAEDVGELRREHSVLAVEVGRSQARLDEHLRARP